MQRVVPLTSLGSLQYYSLEEYRLVDEAPCCTSPRLVSSQRALRIRRNTAASVVILFTAVLCIWGSIFEWAACCDAPSVPDSCSALSFHAPAIMKWLVHCSDPAAMRVDLPLAKWQETLAMTAASCAAQSAP